MGILLIVCAAGFVACLAGDLILHWVKFRRTDEKTAKLVNKFRYRGW